MKRIILILTLGIAIASIFGQPFQGPFGLKMGLTLDQLKKIDPNMLVLDRNGAKMNVVPIPYKSFDYYLVTIDDETGLCSVSAYANDIKTNSYGSELRSAYSDIRNALEKKYGTYYETDDVLEGSIWDEPGDFMMGLKLKERELSAGWKTDIGSNLPEDISMIVLTVNSDGLYSGGFDLVYFFSNFAHYLEATEAEADSGL